MFFTLEKSSEIENGISYTTVEEQGESNSALKVDKLVTPLLRKGPMNVLVHILESSSFSTPIHDCSRLSPTHLFKDSHVRPCAKHSEYGGVLNNQRFQD